MNTMYSPDYETAYWLFEALAKAARGRPPQPTELFGRDVFDAFKRVFHGLPSQERPTFVTHAEWLLERVAHFRDVINAQAEEEEQLALEFSATSAALLEADQLADPDDYRCMRDLTMEDFEQHLRERRVIQLWRYPRKNVRENFVPMFYLDPNYVRADLERVSMALREVGEFRTYRFLTTPNRHLDGLAPLESLKEGEIEEVMEAINKFQSGCI